jgi:maltooligosyltrehalose trehalohydrolase
MTDYQPVRPSSIGATRLPDGSWQFVVWAPDHESIELHLPHNEPSFLNMDKDELGYHQAVVKGAKPGTRYTYRFDGVRERPDPASRFQPEGVHGPSMLVDVPSFSWTDANWMGRELEDSVFYELHVATFTLEGTLAAIIPRLDDFAELGVTTIELMPIAQFPGSRNWGYDGVYPYAVQKSYGSPFDLQRLVDAAHARGLAVAIDVVYNHLGPEGNYLSDYGPYFTNHYRTPWGAALNFDGPFSDEVRHFFIQNALYWLRDFHFDVLRLDAVHSIFDASAFPFLAELSTAVASMSAQLGRKVYLIAESDLNDSRVLRSADEGGYGMDAQWGDDFHHSVHTLLTGETSGYYADFGEIHHLATTLKNGWYYSGQYSRYRRRRHGNRASNTKNSNFVACSQNHDQVGNRAAGERLSQLVDFESLKLAAGVTALSPFVPLLFMGEEYGETAPFQYFTSHGDPQLAEAVRRGRQEEFRAFGWKGEIPDPQAESTFLRSKLNHSLLKDERHRTLWRFYQELLRFRRESALGRAVQLAATEFSIVRALMLLVSNRGNLVTVLLHFGDVPATLRIQLPAGVWEKRLDSAEGRWLGPGESMPVRFNVAASSEVKLQPRSLVAFELPSFSSD